MKSLAAIFVGCGRAGGHTLHAWRALPGTRLAAVVDPNEAIRQRLHAELEVPAFARLEDALADVSADVAFISSPNREHANQFLACARRGMHVWIEKPIALTVEDAVAMRQAALRADIKVATPYLSDSHPILADIVARARQREWGHLFQINALRTGSNGFFAQGLGSHPAVLQPEQSGGWIHHHFCHLVDWAMQVGGPVGQVHCRMSTTVPGARHDARHAEAVTAMLQLVSGATCTLVENQLKHKHHQYSIVGERGGMFVTECPKAPSDWPRVLVETSRDDQSSFNQYDAAALQQAYGEHRNPLHVFLDAIQHDRPTTLDRGVEVVRVCSALQESACRTCPITLDPLKESSS